jgi:lipid II:glycine glycyltransferase (peptidoglycan interpeptide bridge formation enzyme)
MTNKDRYIQLCKEREDVMPVFSQYWWLDAVCKDWDAVIVNKGEQVTGSWAYPVEKKARLTLVRTPRLTPYAGPQIFYPPDLKESNLDNFEHETVSALIKQLPEARVWHLAMQPGMKQAGIFKAYGLQQQVQQTFIIDLTLSEQTLLANMKESTRRNIRSGEKELIISNEPNCIEALYEFQKHTLTQKNKPPAWSLTDLKKVMKTCLDHQSTTLWVARSGADIQAIVWQVWDKQRSYYLMGGQNPKVDRSNAMSSLLWHAMKEAKKMGHNSFDLEGSMDVGVERFFRSFGGERALYLVLTKNDSLLWKVKKMVLG